MIRFSAFLLAQIVAALLPAEAGAHIVLDTPQAVAGSYYKAVFNVSHGCEGSPTTTLRVLLPEGVTMAKPMPKPGWKTEIIKQGLEQPAKLEGHAMTERVKEIVWQGGLLPGDQFDTFTLMVRLPAETGPLAFPVVQICEAGETRWVEVPPEGKTAHDLAHPAPVIHLVPSGAPQ